MRARSHKERATNILRIAIVLLFMGLAIWAITLNHYGRVIADHEPWLWLTVALVSVGPELAGIVIGVVTIDYLNERRQDDQLRNQLTLQLSSTHNDVVDAAYLAIKSRGWFYNGFLRRSNLYKANLSGVDLERTNLSGANLWRANLSKALLRGANLSRANLYGANLSEAELMGANLSRAELWRADLSRTNLEYSHLKGAILAEANLSGAYLWTINKLEQAKTLEGATMPDNILLGCSGKINLGGGRIIGMPTRKGPTFEEWKDRYLATHGGTVIDQRIAE